MGPQAVMAWGTFETKCNEILMTKTAAEEAEVLSRAAVDSGSAGSTPAGIPMQIESDSLEGIGELEFGDGCDFLGLVEQRLVDKASVGPATAVRLPADARRLAPSGWHGDLVGFQTRMAWGFR